MTTIHAFLVSSRRGAGALACPFWPPDLFAICGKLLKTSGAYLQVFGRSGASSALRNAHAPGVAWRSAVDKLTVVSSDTLADAVPLRVTRAWKALSRHEGLSLGSIPDEPDLVKQLLTLTMIADEASVGIGVNEPDLPFLIAAQRCLEDNELASFCWQVDRDFAGVMGKQHTPQRGATFRSLTHHLALYAPNEIVAQWIGPYAREPKRPARSVNLLLLPWPMHIGSDDFRLTSDDRGTNSGSRYFEYAPAKEEPLTHFRRRLARALRTARRHSRHIDAIVFPELALTLEQYFIAEELAIKNNSMLIAGVRIPGELGQGGNFCLMQPAGLIFGNQPDGKRARGLRGLLDTVRLGQAKHHRWCLDHAQICQYQLGGNIPPGDLVWENIALLPRQLHFVTLGAWMTWSVLICEDLARQDPAGDLIRSVAPNLLIALLMDGPQIPGRWPSRYASVLAEDPGTSVLTLTSLGMAERARPTLRSTGRRAEKSRAIGLWRDAQTGEQEIVIDPDDDACILTLGCASQEERAADGRGDQNQAHFPIFAGYESFRSGV
jgi:hypothetical protein